MKSNLSQSSAIMRSPNYQTWWVIYRLILLNWKSSLSRLSPFPNSIYLSTNVPRGRLSLAWPVCLRQTSNSTGWKVLINENEFTLLSAAEGSDIHRLRFSQASFVVHSIWYFFFFPSAAITHSALDKCIFADRANLPQRIPTQREWRIYLKICVIPQRRSLVCSLSLNSKQKTALKMIHNNLLTKW